MFLAARGIPPAGTALLGLSCILLAACGSAAANGLAEIGSDARMARLAGRVEALRRIGRGGALSLSLIPIAASLALSVFSLPPLASVLLLAAVASYTLLYTFVLKRRSPFGTVPGAIPGALPVLIGYAVIAPEVGADGLLLFAIMLLWQPPHFWALALNHQEDYRSAGVPVLPVTMGEPYTKVLIFLYAAALPPLSLALWWFGFRSGYFAVAAVLLAVFFLASCWRNIVAGRRFGRAFGASVVYITGLLAAVILDAVFAGPVR
jgi:protoheme IX farnesyltransferase